MDIKGLIGERQVLVTIKESNPIIPARILSIAIIICFELHDLSTPEINYFNETRSNVIPDDIFESFAIRIIVVINNNPVKMQVKIILDKISDVSVFQLGNTA